MSAPREPNSSVHAGGLVELAASDLPAYCPNPSMPLWSSHPRVYLDVVNDSEIICPYCGTRYRLKRGVQVHDHGFETRELHQHAHHQFIRQLAQTPRSEEPARSGREAAGVALDRLGNTTLEQLTRWLRRGR